MLQRYQVPIIIGWAFMMFLPNRPDLLCLRDARINFTKFMVCL